MSIQTANRLIARRNEMIMTARLPAAIAVMVLIQSVWM
jgi:hypothetical protein